MNLSDFNLVIGKRNTCVETTNVWRFKHLKNVQIELKKTDKGGHRNLLDHFEADFLQ